MICLASETEGDTTESDCGTANCRAVLREEGSGQIIGMTIMAPPPSPALTSTLRLLRDLPTKGGISTSAVESELQSLPGRLSSLPSSSDCEKESAGHEIHSLPNAVSTPVNCSRQMISSVVACGLNVTQDSADEPRNGMVGLTTYDAENKPNAPSSVGVMDEEEGEDEVRGNSTTSTSLDEALSAAMEAIAQASQLNGSCDRAHNPPDVLESSMEIERQSAHFAGPAMQNEVELHNMKLDDMELKVYSSFAGGSGISDLISIPGIPHGLAGLRAVVRPALENALVDRLWKTREMGAGNPQSLILAMWFFVSRHFGIGCRTEHARLVFGNLTIGLNSMTGQKQLQFVRMSQPLLDLASTTSSSPVSVLSSSGINSSNLLLLKPRHADHVVPARPEQLERCPVALFETYCARRPLTTGLPHSPFYLQPDREFCSSPLPPGYRSTANSDSNSATNSNYAAPITSDAAGLPGVWYLASAMGKNKIGSLMNSALQRLGLPINRQVTLVRFCDSLVAAAALPLPNGEVIAQVFGHV